MAYAECYGLPVLPFRFFNVFGPLQAAGHAYAAVIPAFLDAVVQGRPLPAGRRETEPHRTYVHIVVDVLTSALLGRATGGPTNLAFGFGQAWRTLSGLSQAWWASL